jgi:hypothetical protein
MGEAREVGHAALAATASVRSIGHACHSSGKRCSRRTGASRSATPRTDGPSGSPSTGRSSQRARNRVAAGRAGVPPARLAASGQGRAGSSAPSRSGSSACPSKRDHRVQFYPVWCDARLTVDLVPEADTRDRRLPTEPEERRRRNTAARGKKAAAGPSHLGLLDRPTRAIAPDVGELHDHRLAAITGCRNHEVHIVVVLDRRLPEHRPNPNRLALDAVETRRVAREARRRRQLAQPEDSSGDGVEIDSRCPPVGQCLHGPPPHAALQGARRGRCADHGSRCDRRDEDGADDSANRARRLHRIPGCRSIGVWFWMSATSVRTPIGSCPGHVARYSRANSAWIASVSPRHRVERTSSVGHRPVAFPDRSPPSR